MLRAVACWSSLVGIGLCASCGGSDADFTPGKAGAASAGGDGPLVSGGANASGAASGVGNATAAGGRAGTTNDSGGATNSAGAASNGSAGTGSGGTGATDPASKTALEQLKAWIALAVPSRPSLVAQAFAKAALTKADAGEARQLLASDYVVQLKATRGSEVGATEKTAKTIKVGDVSMKYLRAQRGQKPANGWNLFISMHGGGDTDAATNDSQWQNQLALVDGYEPKDAIWVAPRAPTDEWNMWFREHMDGLFEHLIANFVAFEGVDPNHVYLNGYSAGGDGAYQMGPRIADAWAGVGMSAGHPNDASPLSLRNTAFAIHVGGADTAFDRNLKAAEWGGLLDTLALADVGAYVHQWQVHAGLPHWMDLADASSIPFMQANARNPIPNKVVWRQSGTLRPRFYWLAAAPADVAAGSEITASYAGQTIELSAIKKVKRITLRVSDAMLDQDEPVSVKRDGTELFSGNVPRTIGTLYSTLQDRGDPSLMFSGEVPVKLE